jgi:hypothetical protein
MQAGAEIISLRSELAEAKAALAAANARIGDDDKVALWMMGHGYATGHGDTIQDMLDELEIQAKVRAALAQTQPPAPDGPSRLPTLRCDSCDNGIEVEWAWCPYCGAAQFPPSPDGRDIDRTTGEG